MRANAEIEVIEIEPVESAGAVGTPGWRGATRVVRGVLAVGLAVVIGWGIWQWDQARFLEWKAQAGPLPFFAALAVLPAFGVPTTPFYLLAGATFGVAVGLAGSAVSLAINLLLCYGIAHSSGLRPWLWRYLRRWRREQPKFEGGQAWRFALLVKLVPGAPTFLKNYLLVLAGVPFGVYFVLSFVVTLVWAAGFIVLGESMLTRDFGRTAWVLAALMVPGLGVWLGVRLWRGKHSG